MLTGDDVNLLERVAPDVLDIQDDDRWFARYLQNGASTFLVAAIAGRQMVGQVSASLNHHPDRAPDLYVDDLAVTPAWRRRGIARRLLDKASEIGRGLGCAQMWIVTEEDNDEARALYQSRGAEPTAIVMYEYNLADPAD